MPFPKILHITEKYKTVNYCGQNPIGENHSYNVGKPHRGKPRLE
jgi:hypothetical protein